MVGSTWNVILEEKGRHNACEVFRAVTIVEAMAAIVILDFYLKKKSTSWE
jgi:chorismate synthase